MVSLFPYYSLWEELLRRGEFAASRDEPRLADAAIAFVSVSGEDRTLSDQKTPRHWSTASSDVLAGVGARRPSVHIVTRVLLLALALQLRNAGQWTHCIKWHLVGCCTWTECTTSC
jgi:hypothetical protein